MTITLKVGTLALLSLVLAGLSGCSGSKNVTKEEQQAVKDWLLQGLTEEMKASNKFLEFEGVEDPDAKEGKVKYVWVKYKVGDGQPGEMLLKFVDGKVVKNISNPAGKNWKTEAPKLNW